MASTAASNGAASLNGNDKLELKNMCEESRSPYVRSHAPNPIAWQLWSPSTLALARTHSRLIFLSIGYSSCHWCHVMANEAFSNPDVANLLNTSFIPIKLDREERPDIDRIYMNYVQATTGHGGWPLNVFITPDLQPIFGGTYFPGPESEMVRRGEVKGFLEICERVKYMWMTQRERCIASARGVTEQLREFAAEGNISGGIRSTDTDTGLELELLEEAYTHFSNKYDTLHAGFGTSGPKFPTPMNLQFLLELGQFPSVVRDVVGTEECVGAARMALKTLRNMARGGIKDQVGNGFARYSVTRDWSLPHFEKMLYDQAQLLTNYLTAFLLTGDSEMLSAVYDISTYLTTPSTSGGLSSPSGGFYSSEDADSYPSHTTKHPKREGAFYVWAYTDFTTAISNDLDAKIAAEFYNVKEGGNVDPENDIHNELKGQNVLCIASSPEALAKKFDMPKEDVANVLKDVRRKLRTYRDTHRPRPALDDKIIVSWNGLAISALARTSSALEGVDDAKAGECKGAAIKATKFIKNELWDQKTGQLWRVWREGRGETKAFADDYAFLIQGLCDLYEATWDDAYLQWADELMQTQITHFHDPSTNGFFSTPSSQPDILLRLKDGLDNAEPSTNGISALNLYRLSSYLSHTPYTTLATSTLSAFANEIEQHPFLFPSLLSSVVISRVGMRGIVLTGNTEETKEACLRIRARVRPGTSCVRVGDGARWGWLRERNELVKGMRPERACVQICEEGVCGEVVELSREMVEKALSWGGVGEEGEGLMRVGS